MSKRDKFIGFLESLKDNTNATLIETIKQGFTLLEEVDLGQAEPSLYSTGKVVRLDMIVDGKVIERDVFSRGTIMRKADKMRLDEVTIRTHTGFKTYDTDFVKDSDGDWIER